MSIAAAAGEVPDAEAAASTLIAKLVLEIKRRYALDALPGAIEGLWLVQPTFRPGPSERIYRDPFVIVSTGRQGCAYLLDTIEFDGAEYLGQSVQFVIESEGTPNTLKLAVLDSLLPRLEVEHGAFSASPTRHIRTIEGSVERKAVLRAEIVADEINELYPDGASVALVGFSASLFAAISKRHQVTCYELAPELLDGNVLGHRMTTPCLIHHGSAIFGNFGFDLLLMTAMTFTNGSYLELIQYASRAGVPVVVYAQTAANLGVIMSALFPEIHVYVGEHVPFYNFEGVSEIEVVRKV